MIYTGPPKLEGSGVASHPGREDWSRRRGRRYGLLSQEGGMTGAGGEGGGMDSSHRREGGLEQEEREAVWTPLTGGWDDWSRRRGSRYGLLSQEEGMTGAGGEGCGMDSSHRRER